MQKKIIYEQPLNERVRNLLRQEHLFQSVDFRSDSLLEWDCRNILASLLGITDLLSRSDFKNELIKELERHTIILNTLKDNPDVNQDRLDNISSELDQLLKKLRDKNFQPGYRLKNDELIISFKQRISIPGGTCSFDLPRIHQWLNLPFNQRKKDIDYWTKDLEPIKNAVFLALRIIRNSTNPSKEIAEAGLYQKKIESNTAYQLIRILLPVTSSYYPEISGGKHRFTIRFLEGCQTNVRPVQSKKNIEFELLCCVL